MAGNAPVDEVAAYLSRLVGEQVSAEHPIRLRSVHRAALSSWARKQNVPLNAAVLGSGKSFTLADLLRDAQSAPPPEAAVGVPPRALASLQPSAGAAGIGIDIEDVDALPTADDYREHPFFRDNFTPAEIAYCLRQADMRASLCGTWAAKEAVVKSGLALSAPGNLRSIEITRDALGRPGVAGCHLSISHTAKTAVAVCIAVAPALPLQPRPPAGTAEARMPQVAARKQRPSARYAAVAALAFVIAVIITSAWHAWAALR